MLGHGFVGMTIGRTAPMKVNVRRNQAAQRALPGRSGDRAGTIRLCEETGDLFPESFWIPFVRRPGVACRADGRISKLLHESSVEFLK